MRKETFNPTNPDHQDRIDFSNVKILSLVPIKKGHEYFYLVKCKNCGKEFHKAKWTFGIYRCQCYKTVNGAYNFQGYKEISANYFKSYKANAKSRGLEFSVTKEDIWNQWIKQDKKCALSGISLKIERNYQKVKGTTASLDRIDSSKGYTVDNIQWVHKDLNRMKWNLSTDYFIELCKLVANHNK